MIRAFYKKHTFRFIRPGGTSRGVLHEKDSWYIILFEEENPTIKGIGECSILRGLSIDDRPDFENKLIDVCNNIHSYMQNYSDSLLEFPAIQFGLETALLDIENKGTRTIYESQFTCSNYKIPINGLIWMGSKEFMLEQIQEKLNKGFNCIKMKIGAIDFDTEISLIEHIRKHYNKDQIEIRVDANGAFTPNEALNKLNKLNILDIHSIEQPIKAGQWEEMNELCRKTPIPIALDEELIGNISPSVILETIHPQFIILKPSLLGGFKKSEEWINEAKKRNIGWWVTSALEGNIGLNAIAQWTSTLNSNLPQGLGTGQLYSNNIPSPLEIINGTLFNNPKKNWDLTKILA
jgi:o-succinylbenzoate synthase